MRCSAFCLLGCCATNSPQPVYHASACQVTSEKAIQICRESAEVLSSFVRDAELLSACPSRLLLLRPRRPKIRRACSECLGTDNGPEAMLPCTLHAHPRALEVPLPSKLHRRMKFKHLKHTLGLETASDLNHGRQACRR